VRQASHRHVEPILIFAGRSSDNRSLGKVEERTGIP
jgi:hypothetical protein